MIPVSDKGFVEVEAVSLGYDELAKLKVNLAQQHPDAMVQLPYVHMRIKCPVFVRLQLANFGLNTMIRKSNKLEFYEPSVEEIGAKTLEISEEIVQHIKQTQDTTLVNIRGYEMEACDSFVAQSALPMSVYNEVIVSGKLTDFIRFTKFDGYPANIECYRKAVEDALVAEWGYFEHLIRKDYGGEKRAKRKVPGASRVPRGD